MLSGFDPARGPEAPQRAPSRVVSVRLGRKVASPRCEWNRRVLECVSEIARTKMREHIKIIGILNLIYGGFNLLGALVVFLIFGGISGLFAIVGVVDDPNAGWAAGMFGVLGVLIGGLIVLHTLPAIIVGWGLLKGYGWARILAIILAIFDLFNFPLGTALGIYTLVILLDSRTEAEFRALSQPAPVRAA